MHRLQVSLQHRQFAFLAERAKRERVSIAEIVRQLIEHEVAASAEHVDLSSLWALAGIAEDHGPLISGIPVSERPDLYLAEAAISSASAPAADTTTSASGEQAHP
jgi:hypothetical protein